MSPVAIDEVCAVAIAEAFRGDGEILCNPIGTTPIIGGRLARATFEPDMVMTDTISVLAANTLPVGDPDAERLVEAWMPYRDIFDVVWSGRRHIVMGASQIDARGNQNLAAIGDWRKPKAQLLGLRGAPGNLVNHATTYWVPNHSTRTFVPEVDVVSGPGYDRVAGLSVAVWVRDVTVDHVVEATGFELVVGDEVGQTRLPTDEELRLIREVIDPHGLRKAEFGS